MAQDADAQELLERRMVERVEKQVRSRLFAIYGIIGGGVIGALAWFGYDVITDFRDTVDKTAFETAAAEAKTAVAGAVSQAEAAALAARAAADAAGAEAGEARARLSVLNDFQSDTQVRITRTLDDVNKLSGDIDRTLEEIRGKVADADMRVERLRDKSEATYLGGEYAELVQQLAGEVARLDAELNKLKAIPGVAEMAAVTGDTPDVDPDNTPVLDDPQLPQQSAALSAQQIQQSAEQLNFRSAAPVFVQFAGVITREEIERLGRGLAEFGFQVPPQERLPSAAGRHEVRYFFDYDADEAQRVADAVNVVLQQQGWKPNVTAELFQDFRGKPQPGVFELWIEPVRN